ncbi:MAG: MMPL family transporter [Rubrivivax sp.]|nr:MMPL family transporter [Rubrivivax sp.]
MPWPLALLIVLAVHVISAWFIPRLQLNNAPDLYYPAGSPAVQLRDELRREFPSDEMLTVVFQGPDLYGRDVLKRLHGVATKLEAHPLVDRVTTVTTLERISGSADGFSVEPLVDVGRLAKAAAPGAARDRVLKDRFAPGLLASRDGSTLAMAVRPKPLAGSSDRLRLQIAVINAVNEAGLGAYYAGDAGPITVDVAQLVSMMQDTRLFVPLTAMLGLALLGWVVGRLRPVVIGAVAMSTVILPVVAAVASTGQPYTMATAILPSLLAAYTLATLMHLYAGVQRAQASGLSRRESVHRALAETLRPGAFNVLTTGAGLLSLVLVPMPPIQVFGIAGAAGTAMVFLTVFVLAPPFLVSWDQRRWPIDASTMGRMGRIASRMAIFSMRRPRLMVGATVALVLACAPLAALVKVETDMLAFFSPTHPVNRHTDIVETKLAGVTSLEISLRADRRDGLQDVATLRAVRQFQNWMEALPEVDRSVSMVDLVEEMHWAMNAERAGFRVLPPNDRLLSQYLLVYDGRDLYELVNRDFQHARIMLNLNVHGATQIGQTIDRIRQQVQDHPLPGLTVDVGGYGRLFADQVDLLVTGQISSFAGAFVQIFLLMAVMWRSLGASAVCLVPNVAPLYFIFALMGATGIHLDMATVMIAGVVLGITVDDTIHLYHGYKERLAKGMQPVLAIARAFQSSGRAVLATSLLLTAQFGLLATSDFIPTANFGLMTAVGLVAGQLAELLLLPALLVLKDGRRRAPVAPATRAPKVLQDDAWAPTRLLPRPTGEQGAGSVLVCQGEACKARGAEALWKRLSEEQSHIESRGLGSGALIVQTGCLGCCEKAPVVQVVRRGRYCSGRDQAEIVREVRRHLLRADRPGETA